MPIDEMFHCDEAYYKIACCLAGNNLGAITKYYAIHLNISPFIVYIPLQNARWVSICMGRISDGAGFIFRVQ